MRTARTNGRTRKANGSTMAETGPAIMILFMFLFFPLVNILAMSVAYGSCFTLNDVQCREAATLPKTQAENAGGIIKKQIVEQWKHTGLGAFVQSQGDPKTNLAYFAGAKDGNGSQDQYVEVTTTVTARPFVTVPFFFPVPGMSAPVTFTISNRRMVENPHFV
jgi:hypothetical protein